MEQLQENMSAAYVELSEADWTELEKILKEYPVSGEWYATDMMKLINNSSRDA